LAEVNAFELVVRLEVLKDLAHAIEVLDVVVLEGELGQLRSLLQILKDFVDHGRIYRLVFH